MGCDCQLLIKENDDDDDVYSWNKNSSLAPDGAILSWFTKTNLSNASVAQLVSSINLL